MNCLFLSVNGRRETMEMSGKEPEEICKWTEHMRGRSGVQIVRLLRNNHTETPSTQGIWHTFMFRDSETALAKFPNPEYSAVKNTGKTATDHVLEELHKKLGRN